MTDAFYTSGTFWLTAVLIVLGIATITLAYFALPAKKRLAFGIRTATAMVRGPEGIQADIEVRRRSDGYELSRPYHVEVLLENRGRTAIQDADFSNDRPVRFHLGAPIKVLYETRSEPSDLASPALNIPIDDDVVELKPALLAKGQRIIIPLVVEGRPTMTHDPHSLNATVVNASVNASKFDKRVVITLFSLFSVSIITLLVWANFLSHQLNVSEVWRTLGLVGFATLIWIIAATPVVTAVYLYFRFSLSD